MDKNFKALIILVWLLGWPIICMNVLHLVSFSSKLLACFAWLFFTMLFAAFGTEKNQQNEISTYERSVDGQ